MVFSVQQIKYEFLAYIKGLGGRFEDWYVGIHGIEREADPWIYKPALTAKASTTVLKYFREILKTDGADPARVPEEATFVFLFRKGSSTSPPMLPLPVAID